MKNRVVFMGSPDFAVPALQALNQHFDVVGVVTQPDRAAGRGRQQIRPPIIKSVAQEIGLPIIQPASLRREPQAIQQIREWEPDVIVVAAFGQILRPELLDLPSHGCINVHASLLPRWRGAAPINAAILHGDEFSGVTIMRMDAGLDTGPILSQRSIPIKTTETAGSLFDKLSRLGAELIVETLPPYLRGEIEPQHQDDNEATYAPMLKKADGELDPHLSAMQLERKVRAFNPWPGAYIYCNDTMIKIHSAQAAETPPDRSQMPPGYKLVYQGLPAIATKDGLLCLETVQPAGKTSMPGKHYLQGARDWSENPS